MTIARRSKYRAIPVTVDGVRFASKAEARRYGELKLLQKAGKIRKLECHPAFPYHDDKGEVAFTYYADFAYFEGEIPGRRTVEDVKGIKTPVYKLKKRLIEPRYSIKIMEVR
jgi:Protein of unknown function (DUF1064)